MFARTTVDCDLESEADCIDYWYSNSRRRETLSLRLLSTLGIVGALWSVLLSRSFFTIASIELVTVRILHGTL